MIWKCPPLNLFNWSNYWKWKEDMKDIDMEFTVTVTYKITNAGENKEHCFDKIEAMTADELNQYGIVHSIDIVDGVQF